MNRWMNYLRGMVRITAAGPFPERLMNLCGQHGLDFWAVSWPDDHTLCLTTRCSCLDRLRELAERVDCEVRVEWSWGLPDFLLRFRRRYAFLLGLVLSLAAVGLLSRMVLTIEVTGNETIPTPVILNELRLQGVRTGVYGPALDRKQLAQELVVRLKKLAWAGINRSGTRLEVSVRELRQAPVRVDEVEYVDIVAEADGLVLSVVPEQGDAQVKAGDTVVKGDVLISGVVTMEPPQWSELPERYYKTHARGRVTARTWRRLDGMLPLHAMGKVYTGEKKIGYGLAWPGGSMEIFRRSSISPPFCDKLSSVRKLPLSLTLRRTTWRPYELREIELDPKAGEELLRHCLRERLAGLLGEEGELRAIRFTSRTTQDALYVTAWAECREEIGQEAPGTRVIPEDLPPIPE